MRCGYLGLVGVILGLCSTAAGAQDGVEEYRALLRQVDGLVVYNQMLERQIQDQQLELQQLETAIEQVPELEVQIPPVLNRILEGIQEFIATDVPFLPEERTERVAQLQTIVERPDVALADKFRRVFEMLQIEIDYGRTMEAYNGQLDIDGETRDVEFLKVGRISLLYQTPDGEYTGAWDHRNREWVPLGYEFRNSVRQGLQMARAQVAPDMVLLPVPAPEEG